MFRRDSRALKSVLMIFLLMSAELVYGLSDSGNIFHNPFFPDTAGLNDLPLVEVPSRVQGPTMAVLLTGDGGWRSTDRGIAKTLAAHGVPVAALDTLFYFWKRRTPEGAAADLSRIIAHYIRVWNRERVVVIGYSYGADVLPFMLTRLPKSQLNNVEWVVLLAPGKTVDFEFHLRNWFSNYTPKTAMPVFPELEKLRGMNILCFYGTQDGETICRGLNPAFAKVIALNAGHRLERYYQVIARDILDVTGPP